jgi:peptide/nickel transport system substrate-binding protein
LISGGADLILNSDASIFAEGTAAGFTETNYTFNGGIGFMLNTSKPPFDDVRARNALAYALDLEQLSDAVTKGYPSVPETLFTEDSPFFEDIPLQTYDAKKAQDLFDELADEGTPVEFAYTVFPGPGQTVFDALQAQLSTYDNVTVTADQRDTSEQGVVGTTGDYQVLTSSLAFSDPASRLWATLHGDAERTNYSRINDPELNEALDAAVAATDAEEQKEHWATVQELLAELDPYILYQQFFNGTLSASTVNGIVMYGYTTPAAADLWLQQ